MRRVPSCVAAAPRTLAAGSASCRDPHPLLLACPAESDDDGGETLNAKAVAIIGRVESKLTGRDFGEAVLDGQQQVDQLIRQATSAMNLSQCYIGWCPFW